MSRLSPLPTSSLSLSLSSTVSVTSWWQMIAYHALTASATALACYWLWSKPSSVASLLASSSCPTTVSDSTTLTTKRELQQQEKQPQAPLQVEASNPPKLDFAPLPPALELLPNSEAATEALSSSSSSSSSTMMMMMQPMGVVRSIFQLCVGTPRQGLLAPQTRGWIELTGWPTTQAAQHAVDGLQDYSHIWIVFVFHLNTVRQRSKDKHNNHNHNNNHNTRGMKNHSRSNGQGTRMMANPENHHHNAFHGPAKIAPPALGGKRIGVLATRSPHRFNPIGMSLVQLDRIETRNVPCISNNRNSDKKSSRTMVCLHVSGLDLVDGTPVLDIKPYVPQYDAPPLLVPSSSTSPHHHHCHSSPSPSPLPLLSWDQLTNVRVPTWLQQGLATFRNVIILDSAQRELHCLLQEHPKCLEFYGPHRSSKETVDHVLEMMLLCIRQVLSMDVRSTYQTNKVRYGQSQAHRSQRFQHQYVVSGTTTSSPSSSSSSSPPTRTTTTCTQQLDRLLVHYTVIETSTTPHHDPSQGSGAKDVVTVVGIQLLRTQDERHPGN